MAIGIPLMVYHRFTQPLSRNVATLTANLWDVLKRSSILCSAYTFVWEDCIGDVRDDEPSLKTTFNTAHEKLQKFSLIFKDFINKPERHYMDTYGMI
jgi:hypothetical protein